MQEDTVFDELARHAIIPVVALDDIHSALPLADALLEGGLPVLEITFRTEAAGAVLEKLRSERPELLLGAGTVLSEDNARTAKESGARFAVSPGLNPKVVECAHAVGLPFAPGVATPSEVEGALALGCSVMKFFPAGALGGGAYIKAMSAPYSHLGIRFIATGGVNEDNLAAYLSLPSVPAVGGTWIVQKSDVVAGRWKAISARCAKAVATVRAVRGMA